MNSLIKPKEATVRNFQKENERRPSEEEINHQIISRSNETTAVLNKYSDKPRNLVIIDDSDPDIDEAAEVTSTTQKRALTTKIETTTRTQTRTRTRTSSINYYEDIEPPKIISKVFNDSLQQTNQHQQRIYERPSSEGAQTSCPRKQLDFIDNPEIIPRHHYLKTRMNLQHISEINGIDGDKIEKEKGEGKETETETETEKQKEREKGLRELIAERGELDSIDSICHIDGSNLAQVKSNNIQKVSHDENIQLSNANNEEPSPIFQHISDFDCLENHTSATTAVNDTAVDDAPEQRTPNPNKTPNKNLWSFAYHRYFNRIGSSRISQVSEAILEAHNKMVKPGSGGPTPTNRLTNSQNAAAPLRNRALPPIVLDEPPYKKQRTEQVPSSKFREPNQFEQGASQDQKPVRQIPTQGQYNNSSYQEAGYSAAERWGAAVNEYQAVDQLVHPMKRTRNRKVNRPLGSHDFSNGSSGFRAEQKANAKRIAKSSCSEDLEDPIDVDELQAPPSATKTTLRVEVPSHGNEQIPVPRANRPQKSQLFSKSQASKQISLNYLQKRGILMQSQVEGGSEDELSQDTAPELSRGKQGNKSHDEKNTYNHDCDESYGNEQSRDTTGDISHTDFGNRGNGSYKLLNQGRSKKFGVNRLFSESRYWHRETTSETCHLILDQSNGNVRIMNNMTDKHDGFLIRPASILSFKYCPESCKMVIGKSKEASPMHEPKIFIDFYSIKDAYTFRVSLLNFTSDNTHQASVHESDIDQIFLRTCQILNKRAGQEFKKRSRAQELPEDLQVMASNQRERTVEDPHSLKHDSRQSYVDNPPRPKRPKLHEKMQDLPAQNDSNGLKGNAESIEATDFYEITSETNGTCTSLRSTDRRKSYKTALKERTPSPERWSEVNRDWADAWHTSVVYPKTGKKTATVDKQDIYRLDNGEFLNDNLIMFYLLWLEQHHPELTKRVYVHNTFFYASLTKTAKGKRGINYEAVERWTAKVDLPSYDYIIVPSMRTLIEESQSLKNGAKPELNSEIESCETSKPTTPSESPQPTSERLSNEIDETEVDNSLKDLSLMNSDGDETQTPLDVQAVEHIPPSNHGLPTISPGDESDNVTASKFATNVIDLAQSSSPLAKPDSAVKGKKHLPNRAYNLKQPRIITLDSLAQKHPSTCSNLKDYMVAEIKAKKQISITPPKTLGMTAKTQAKDDRTGLYPGTGLPLQGNYCDCGVYLLSYMEEFFERPDGFIEDIVENKYKVEGNRNDTPEFRVKIRNILFKLQAEQVLESEVERPNPQTTSLSTSSRDRKQPAFAPSTLDLGRNNDNWTGVARSSPDSLPIPKRKEVINIEDSQNNLQEQSEEESASNRVNDANYIAIEDKPKSRGCGRETRQAARTTVESGPSERCVHFENRDSFEEQESTQESANHRSMTQQQQSKEEISYP
ncbi:hypothetical protein DID88_005893 [Monilinia fructigena]|uniref:Ubiquitin-like protease family profile domain-containing protein n=1 Tax=Monilinia fructigena TaxID=38457 RepID=A0A395J1I0_9HELO|nr:hypothetical protein DID88_005893 [Monilinia fructigena]